MPQLRRPHQRSTAAVVLTRADTHSGGAASRDGAALEDRPRAWPTVLIWVLLSSAIAALWASLLLGDSLGVSG